MSLDVLEGEHGRLLHDVAQVTREGELAALAAAEAGLYEEYLASYGGPCKSRYHTGILVALVAVARVLLHAEQVAQVGSLHSGVAIVAVGGVAACQAAVDLAYLLIQFAHARLAGVVLHDGFEGLLVDLDLALLDAVGLLLLGHEVAARYLHLLLGQVAAHFDELHAVEQGRGDVAYVVGRGDEHHVGEVVVHVEEVIVEGVVLLGVEHLEQGR